jgi:hypothetical protein
MPEIIFVIYNGYEYRTYTTILAFATALTDGYAADKKAEVRVFVPADWADDRITKDVLAVAKKPSLRHLPQPSNWHAVMQQNGQYVHPSRYTPAQKKFARDWEKKQKDHHKKHKDRLVAELTKALGRTV